MTELRDLKNSQASGEWYTPLPYLEAARKVMGSIELDPASSDAANLRVNAERIFTMEENGLLQKWFARTLWLNAPGRTSGSGQAKWQQHLITEYKAGRTKEAIMCVFNASGTETRWFQDLLGNYPMCLTNHRIKFIPEAGRYADTSKNQPLHGNAFVYFGANRERFAAVFTQFGKVIPAWQSETPAVNTYQEAV
jgi:hypothetical protein